MHGRLSIASATATALHPGTQLKQELLLRAGATAYFPAIRLFSSFAYGR